MFKYFWVVFSFEWLFASVAAKVREESPDTHWNFIHPSWFSFSHPWRRVTLKSCLCVLHFIFYTSSVLPLHSLFQGPSIYSWQFGMNIALKGCRGQEYIWDCTDSSPHCTACTLWQTTIQKSTLGKKKKSTDISFFLLTLQHANIAVPHVNLFKLHPFTQGKMLTSLA